MRKFSAYSFISIFVICLFVGVTFIPAASAVPIVDSSITTIKTAAQFGNLAGGVKIIQLPNNVQVAGFADGSSWNVMRTTNLGSTWTDSVSGTLSAVSGDIDNYLDTVYSIGSVGSAPYQLTVKKSTNAGVSFTDISAVEPSGILFPCVIVENANTFRIIGERTSDFKAAIVYTSTDGGATLTGPVVVASETLAVMSFGSNKCSNRLDAVFSTPYKISFSSTNEVVNLIYTTDYGVTWTTSTIASYIACTASSMITNDGTPRVELVASSYAIYYPLSVDRDGTHASCTNFTTQALVYKFTINGGGVSAIVSTMTGGVAFHTVILYNNYIILSATGSGCTPCDTHMQRFNADLSGAYEDAFLFKETYLASSMFWIKPGVDIEDALAIYGGYNIISGGTSENDLVQYNLNVEPLPPDNVLQGGTSPITATKTLHSVLDHPHEYTTRVIENNDVVIASFPCHDNGDECVHRSVTNDADWSFVATHTSYAENIDAAPNSDTIYGVGTAFGTTSPMLTKKSTNNGATYTAVSSLVTGVKSPCVIATSTTNLVVIGLDWLDTQGIVKITSTNGGTSYSGTTQLFPPPFGGATIFSQLSCSAEVNGRMAVRAVTINAAGTTQRSNIYYTEDSGATWSLIYTKDFTSPAGSNFDTFIKSDDIIVDELGIVYYCTRADIDGTGVADTSYNLFAYDPSADDDAWLFISTDINVEVSDYCSLVKYNNNILVVFTVFDNGVDNDVAGYVGYFSIFPYAEIIPVAPFEVGELIRSEKLYIGANGNPFMIASGNTDPPNYLLFDDQLNIYEFTVPQASTPDVEEVVPTGDATPTDLVLSYDDIPIVYVGDYLSGSDTNALALNQRDGNKIYKYDSNLNLISSEEYCLTVNRDGPLPFIGEGPLDIIGYNSHGGHKTPILFTADNHLIGVCTRMVNDEAAFLSVRLNPDFTFDSQEFVENPNSETDSDKWPEYGNAFSSSSICYKWGLGNPPGLTYVAPYNYVTNVIGNALTTSGSLHNCSVDKFTGRIAISTSAAAVVTNSQGTVLATIPGNILSVQIEHDNVYVVTTEEIDSITYAVLDKYHYANGQLTLILESNPGIIDTESSLSPDGKYITIWKEGSGIVHIYDTETLEIVTTFNTIGSIIDADIDVRNNYLYALSAAGTLYRTPISSVTVNPCGEGTEGGLNPECDLDDTIGGGGGGDTPGDEITDTEVDGGFIGDAREGNGAFGNFIVSWSNIFPSQADGAVWFFGIILTGLCIAFLYKMTESPIAIPFGAGIGVILSLAVGWLPIWFMFAITFLLMLIVGKMLFSSSGEE